jgi:hypothetical protein
MMREITGRDGVSQPTSFRSILLPTRGEKQIAPLHPSVMLISLEG